MSAPLLYLLCCRARCNAERLASALAFFPPDPPSYTMDVEKAALPNVDSVDSLGPESVSPRLRWWTGVARNARMRLLPSEGSGFGTMRPLAAPPSCELAVELERRGNARVPLLLWRWPGARATLLVLHGNAADVGGMRDTCLSLAANLRVNVAAVEFTGYGPPRVGTQLPTPTSACADAGAAYEFLTRTRDVRWRTVPGALLLYGQSLGSGPVCWLAARVPVRAIVLHSPIASGLRVVTDNRCLAPCDIFRNLEAASAVARRCDAAFVVHGADDAEVPSSHGVRLAAALNAHAGARRASRAVAAALALPGDGDGAAAGAAAAAAEFRGATLWLVSGAGHNDIIAMHAAEYYARLRAFLADVLVRPDARPRPPAAGRTRPPAVPTLDEAHALATLAAPVVWPSELSGALARAWARAGARNADAAAVPVDADVRSGVGKGAADGGEALEVEAAETAPAHVRSGSAIVPISKTSVTSSLTGGSKDVT